MKARSSHWGWAMPCFCEVQLMLLLMCCRARAGIAPFKHHWSNTTAIFSLCMMGGLQLHEAGIAAAALDWAACQNLVQVQFGWKEGFGCAMKSAKTPTESHVDCPTIRLWCSVELQLHGLSFLNRRLSRRLRVRLNGIEHTAP